MSGRTRGQPARSRFERITEYADTPASAFQRECAAARYSLIESLAAPGALVLEVGCGSGFGLGRLRQRGFGVMGVDLSSANLAAASSQASVLQATAESVPFRTGSVAVAALPEVIYYIDDQKAAVAELARVTAPSGSVVISWPDSRRPGFLRSPFSTSYPRPEDVAAWLAPWCSQVRLLGAFPAEQSLSAAGAVRALASRAGLVPRTMHRRGQLKRLLGMGAGKAGDFELSPTAIPLDVIDTGDATARHVMLYAVGTRK